jgi:hypothetical protein
MVCITSPHIEVLCSLSKCRDVNSDKQNNTRKKQECKGGGFPAVETTRSQREVERLYREAGIV